MRKTKVTNVRIGDYIATAMVNGYPGGFHGAVDAIIHLSPNIIQIYVTSGEDQNFIVDGPAGFTPDQVYRER